MGCSDGEDPPETAWIKIKNVKENSLLPEGLLTEEDVLALLKAAEHPRDKAFLLVIDECGGRIMEILTLIMSRVTFDEYGAVIRLKGSKGERRVRLIASAPALANWIDHHPFRNESDAPVWVNVGTTNHGQPLDYASARKLLRDLARKAGIKKRVNAYTFRHSTITHMANLLTESQLCEYFGWKQGSKMPRVYVHLSGRDVDKRLLEIHGLKRKEEEALKLTVQICARCKARNSPASRFCNTCGSALNIKDALDVDERIRRAEEVMEILLKDNEVKVFLMEKMRQLNLVDRLT
jgi:ribosomal protein L40E